MENSRRFLKKLKIELTYDPEIPLQGINSKKNNDLKGSPERGQGSNLHPHGCWSGSLTTEPRQELLPISLKGSVSWVVGRLRFAKGVQERQQAKVKANWEDSESAPRKSLSQSVR